MQRLWRSEGGCWHNSSGLPMFRAKTGQRAFCLSKQHLRRLRQGRPSPRWKRLPLGQNRQPMLRLRQRSLRLWNRPAERHRPKWLRVSSERRRSLHPGSPDCRQRPQNRKPPEQKLRNRLPSSRQTWSKQVPCRGSLPRPGRGRKRGPCAHSARSRRCRGYLLLPKSRSLRTALRQSRWSSPSPERLRRRRSRRGRCVHLPWHGLLRPSACS